MVSIKPSDISKNGQLQYIYQAGCRPRLPFPSIPVRFRISSIQLQRRQQQTSTRSRWRPQLTKLRSGHGHNVKLFTAERKQFLVSQLWLGSKIAALGYVVIILLLIASTNYYLEIAEYRHPSPSEWSLWTRLLFRLARAAEDDRSAGLAAINWVDVWHWNNRALRRLENADGFDGRNVCKVTEGGLAQYGNGSNQTGLDISKKSEYWRHGYYDVLMSMARAAEHIEGWVIDRTQNICFPPEYVIPDERQVSHGPETGSSACLPKAVPPEKGKPPLAANCDIIACSPHVIYSKILTTKGLSSSQQIDAAIALAMWFEFKGKFDAAKDVYLQAINTASPGFSKSTSRSSTDDYMRLIRPGGDMPTKNIIKLSTAYAVHLASCGQELEAALSMLISILSIRRRAHLDQSASNGDTSLDHSTARLNSYFTEKPISTFASIFRSQRYPSTPLSGEEIFTREHTADCDDAAIMLHIGEILFATRAQIKIGMRWTSEGIQLAESRWRASSNDFRTKERCKNCLKIGLDNWKAMFSTIIDTEGVSNAKRLGRDVSDIYEVVETGDLPKSANYTWYQNRSVQTRKNNNTSNDCWLAKIRNTEAWVTKIKSDIFIEELRQYNSNNSWIFFK